MRRFAMSGDASVLWCDGCGVRREVLWGLPLGWSEFELDGAKYQVCSVACERAVRWASRLGDDDPTPAGGTPLPGEV